MGKVKVSIIIPAFNVEKYIHRAIETSLNQSYQNVEIIIVNDGSTDDTWNVINNYMRQSDKIVGINKSNEGVSTARNVGIENSTGEYLLFLDSDDWLERKAVETLLAFMERANNKLILTDCYFVYGRQDGTLEKYDQSECVESELIFSRTEILNYISEPQFKLRSACYKLFDRNTIINNDIKFNSKIYHGEDGLFVYEYLHYVEGAIYYPCALWDIFEREGSATQSIYSAKWLTSLDAVNFMREIDIIHNINNKCLDKLYVDRVLTIARKCVESGKKEDIKDYMYLRKLAKKNTLKFITTHKSLRETIFFFFLTYAPVFFVRRKYRG